MRVLFVCLGNICRSPAAEIVFRDKAAAANISVETDSCGTGGWHKGEQPDQRMMVAAKNRGYDLSPLRARQFVVDDFYNFDYIFAMDESNLADLTDIMPPNAEAKLSLYLDHHPSTIKDVPDPYYGGDDGFDHVLDLLETASDHFIRTLNV